jgi:hypothetical protein
MESSCILIFAMENGCVTNANTMGFIHVNVHPLLVINLYLTLNLISIHS